MTQGSEKRESDLQEALRRSEEEKEKLISTMTSLKHKLNNSITGFLSLISLLEEKDGEKREMIEGEDIYFLMKEEIDNIREILKSFPHS